MEYHQDVYGECCWNIVFRIDCSEKKAGYSFISIENKEVAPSRVKMITANFIDTSKVYNFRMNDGLDFGWFAIKLDAEISI